jgi:hypothetical protein
MSPIWPYPAARGCLRFIGNARTTDTVAAMKKPWVYKRDGIPGWWVGWYGGGRRRAKALPGKSPAEHFRHMKYAQVNSDVFTSMIECEWHHTVEEYRHAKQVEGLQEASIYEGMLALGHFRRLTRMDSSRRIAQSVPDQYILDRSHEVQKSTLNKDIRNLNAFPNWAVKKTLFEHSSPQRTNEVYTNVDPVLRQAVEMLPVGDWLPGIPGALVGAP